MYEDETITLESEISFRALFEHATIGIVVIGPEANIELVNPHAERLFGYVNTELAGKPVEILMPAAVRAKHEEHRNAWFEKPKSRPMGPGIDLLAVKKDGSVFPVEISLGYYTIGRQKMAMAFVNDITLRKEAEDKLHRINEELEEIVRERTLKLSAALEAQIELNNMKSRFVSFASHEFRTPLSAILSSVSLIDMYDKPADYEKRTKHVKRIKSAIRNLTDILNDFLSLDKLEQGRVETEMELIDVVEFVESCCEDMREVLKQGQYITHKHTGSRTISNDTKILRNILINLLSNASKYSGEGSEIKVISSVAGELVKIEVQDQGIGIPEAEQKDLFKKFFRAKNALSVQGTGLGLNIVQRYLDLIEGSISFESTTGSGTIFTIQFRKTICK